MSEGTLTAPAHPDDSAAPSVEADAPAEEFGAVEDGSAPDAESVPPGFVEKSRFDGLMGAYQREKSRYQRELEELRAQIESTPQNDTQEEEPMPADVAALSQQVERLTEMLLQERAKSARQEVLDRYPDAKPFADLIVGDSPEDLEEVAKAISQRVHLVKGESSATTVEGESEATAPAAVESAAPEAAPAATAPEAPAAPVTGGGATYDTSVALEDRIEDAVKNRSWSDYLRAVKDRALSQQGGVLLEE